MKLLITKDRTSIPIVLLISGLLYGCGPLAEPYQLAIDKIPSDRMSIVGVNVGKDGEFINIKGKAKFNKGMFSTPLDHLVVTIVDPNDKVLYTTCIRYYRHGKPTRKRDTFYFSLTIPLMVPAGNIVRFENNENHCIHSSELTNLLN